MKGKNHNCKNSRRRLFKSLLLVMLVFSLSTEAVTVLPFATEVSAAAQKKRKIIRLGGKSGYYIIDTGYNWWLKDRQGRKVTGFQYISVPRGNRLQSGYYMFDSRGCLCKKKDFHKVNKRVGGRTFRGTFYFGDTNGRLLRKAGWRTINGQKYYLSSYGKRYENCWKSGYYLQSDGTIARSRRISQHVWVDSKGRKCNNIRVSGNSGCYLVDTGYNWYLKDRNGRSLTGFRYISTPKGCRLKTGYYMFDKRGGLCKKKDFHKVNKRVGGRTFRGTFYFGDTNGRLLRKAGWHTINGQKYYLSSYGQRYENCWKSGYYLQSNGTIAKNKQISPNVWVDWEGRKCTKADMTLNSLKKQLQKKINGYRGSWSVYVKNLENGAVINLNDKAMYPASTIKAFVMASTFDQIRQKKLSYNSTIKSLLNSMITVSDNEACNQLVRYNSRSGGFVDGAKTVNQYLKKNGYSKTGCHSSLHPAASGYVSDGRRNLSSAKDCGVLLERIYRGQCVSSRYSKEMEKLLLRQTRRWKIPAGIPSGIRVANKTGETSDVQHDMAIVYGKKTDYVVCVFSSTGNEGYAVPRIQEISRTVYNYLNK